MSEVTARATVTLEINCKSNWSDDTTIAQVRKQAIDDAIKELDKFAQSASQRVKLVGGVTIRVVSFDVGEGK